MEIVTGTNCHDVFLLFVIGFLLGFACCASLVIYQIRRALNIMDRMIATADKASKALSEVTNEKTI